jgi:uncharacterized protein YsxB (DUF464 family)
MQDHCWSGLDEYGNEVICWSAKAEQMGLVNFISAQKQYNALYKGERREYNLP